MNKKNVKRVGILTISCFEITHIPDKTGIYFISLIYCLFHELIQQSAMSALRLCIFLLVIGAFISDYSVNGNIERIPIKSGGM